MPRVVQIAPSDFAFLLDVCPRCYWLKTRRVLPIRDGLPGIFKKIDEGMKDSLTVESLQALGVPAIRKSARERVTSAPISFGDVDFIISGYIDSLWKLDGCGYAIEDYKTAEPNERKRKLYERQLHAYQRCIEFPKSGQGLEVNSLGLTYFVPQRFKRDGVNGAVIGAFVRQDVPIDRASFLGHLEELAVMVASDDMPDPGSSCATCHHVAEVRRYERDHDRRKSAA